MDAWTSFIVSLKAIDKQNYDKSNTKLMKSPLLSAAKSAM